jgi:hypothetical protein
MMSRRETFIIRPLFQLEGGCSLSLTDMCTGCRYVEMQSRRAEMRPVRQKASTEMCASPMMRSGPNWGIKSCILTYGLRVTIVRFATARHDFECPVTVGQMKQVDMGRSI